MAMYRSLLVLLTLFFGNDIFGQLKDVALVNITKQDGLPSNETYCVFKDSKNYIWISTDQGVVRCKGTAMQVINNLPDNVVFKIREDKKGRVWFFSHTGKLAYFLNEKLYPYEYNDSITKYDKQILLNDAEVTDDDEINMAILSNYCNLSINKFGIVRKNCAEYHDKGEEGYPVTIHSWMGNRLFMQLDKPWKASSTFRTVEIVLTYYEKPVHYSIKNIDKLLGHYGAVISRDNEVFCWFDNYVIKLKRDGSYLIKALPQRLLGACSDPVNNTIIVGLAKGGITVLDTQLNIVEHNDVSNNSVTSIEMDSEGEIWFSTLENGVYYTKNSNLQKQFLRKIYDAPVQRMVSIADRFMLFANAEGIFRLSGTKVTTVLKEKNAAVGDLMPGNHNNIFYARAPVTFEGITNKKSADPEFSNIVNFHSSNELVSFENDFLGLNNYNDFAVIRKPPLEKFNKFILVQRFNKGGAPVTAAAAKDTNSILLGTKSSLTIGSISTGNVRNFFDSSNLFSKGVTIIKRMENGIFAIGVRFGGLALVMDTTLIGSITEDQGLLSNSIKYILPVGDRLWLATPNGISVVEFSSYRPLRYTIKNLGEEMGLNNMLIYQLVLFQKNIFAATSKGIYQFSDVEGMLKKAPAPIPLYITSVNSIGGYASGLSNISLPYSGNRLSVNFDVICYNTPKELRSYYRLIGDEDDSSWHNINTSQLVLENLAPGSYKLQIKAEMPKQQRYSAIQTLSITINKPWWQLGWVIISSIVFLLLLVYMIYRWRITTIRKREGEKAFLKQQMSELEQTALRSQMNPHFIFNCLSSIQQLVLTGNKEEANDYLVKFSRLIRKTLELSAKSYISLSQEKDYLSEYLVLEQLRMPNGFDFIFSIDHNIDQYKTEIPNMMLQPIVENCLRHGIKHLKNKKGKIEITIHQVNGCIRCIVSDNGVGRRKKTTTFELTPHKSYGMDIVQKRLTGLPDYTPNNYFLQIEDIVGADDIVIGTRVTLQLPFKTTAT